MAPWARSKHDASCSNLRSFGSKCTVLKKVLVALFGVFPPLAVITRHHGDSAPGYCAPLVPLVLFLQLGSSCIDEGLARLFVSNYVTLI